MKHKLLVATAALLMASAVQAFPVLPDFIENINPVIDPYTLNYLPGDRFALPSGTAETFDPFVTPFGTATSILSYDGTVGGLFWVFGAIDLIGGWSGDFRQANGPFTRSVMYEAQDGVTYPRDADGIGFKTGITEDQLAIVRILGQLRISGPGGKAGAFNFDENNIVTDASGQNFVFVRRDEFVSFTGHSLDEILLSVTQVNMFFRVLPAEGIDEINIPTFYAFPPGSLAFSRLVPIPIPAAAWLFGSALGLLGWLKRRTS